MVFMCIFLKFCVYTHKHIYTHINKIKLQTQLLFLNIVLISRASVANISVPKFQKILCYIVSQHGTMDMIHQNGHSFK